VAYALLFSSSKPSSFLQALQKGGGEKKNIKPFKQQKEVKLMPQALEGLVGRLPTTYGTEAEPGSIDKNGFLTLLIEQMKNQDPMSPMDSSQMSSQLAQFSTLEEIQNMSSLTESALQADLVLAQSINNTMAANLVGKGIKAVSDQVAIADGHANNLSFELEGLTGNVELTIRDSSGNEVRVIEAGAFENGEHSVSWDGRNDQGAELANGNYTFEANVVDSDGNKTRVITYLLGNVDAVRYGAEGAQLLVGDLLINFGDVLEIRENSGDSGGDNGSSILSALGF
jgi:flagellar basal-body rod modification protein FlgD